MQSLKKFFWYALNLCVWKYKINSTQKGGKTIRAWILKIRPKNDT
jgi:hypothetical protein